MHLYIIHILTGSSSRSADSNSERPAAASEAELSGILWAAFTLTFIRVDPKIFLMKLGYGVVVGAEEMRGVENVWSGARLG